MGTPRFHLDLVDPCPNCSHSLGMHNSDGCMVDWNYDDRGHAMNGGGCYCNLALVS